MLQLKEKYKKRKKYMVGGYAVAGLFFAYIILRVVQKLSHAKYNRASLENVMKEKLGDYNVSQALSDELLITAYDYNS